MQKMYYKAIAPLATKFDLSAIKMKDFLESLFKKEIKGTKWYFCPHHGDHGMWVKHTLQGCDICKKLEAEWKLKGHQVVGRSLYNEGSGHDGNISR
jgi:hypothetical protein